jgi:hypothetical protein
MVHQEEFSLLRVQVVNVLLLVAAPLAGGLAFSWAMAESILIGALLANLSFLLLKNDLSQVMQGPLQAVKARFFIKYYLRLTALAVLLFFLVRYGQVRVIGLLLGLSTVVTGIVVAALSQAKAIYFSGKEAL